MKHSKRASIIIVSYNGVDYLGTCLASVLNEIDSHDEIIVVDNASADGSADLVQQQWPEARLIRSTHNLGFGVASNAGAQRAKGCYLVFLNQDTEVLPGWLDRLLEALESDDSVALASSRQLYMAQPEMVHNCGADLHYSGLIFLRGVLEPAGDSVRPPETVQSVVGASFAARRDVWPELGGFDADFFMYYEEMDLSWRAQLAGYRCLCVPDSVVRHDVSLSEVSFNKLYYICRNRQVSLLKNWRWPTLVLLTPGLALAEMAEFGFVIMAGGWAGIRAKLLAYQWLMRNVAQVLHLRRKSQSLRHVPDWVVLGNRTWTLEPREFTGGRSGRILAKLASVPLYFNGWLAWWTCRALGW